MSDDPIARLSRRHLKLLALAARSNPQRLAGLVRTIAGQLETSTGSVVRAVSAAAGSAAGTAAEWARTADAGVKAAIDSGALVVSEAVVAGGAAATATGGAVGWFGSLSFAAKAVVIGSMIGALAVVGEVTGLTDLFDSEAAGPTDGFQAVGVFSGDVASIVSVRSTEDIAAGIPSCEFRHGGIDCERIADVRPLLDEVFADAAAASEALCGLLEGPRFAPAFADGWSAPYDGGTVTLDDWGLVDFGVCDEVTSNE